MKLLKHALVALVTSALVYPPTWSHAAPAPTAKLTQEDIARAEKAAKAYVDGLKSPRVRLQRIEDPSLVQSFPSLVCFSLLFPQYPIGIAPPPGLNSSNVLVVGPDGKTQVIPGTKPLEKLFVEKAPPGQEKDLVQAWLRLSQELHQDGYYKFQLIKEATQLQKEDGKGSKATGKVVVMAGGNGMIEAALTFDPRGKLTDVQEVATLRPGPRPRCHATKLLDPDPIVRRIAEDDLLYMGRPARDYLMEQRARATPDLQKAIDRLWKRIEAENP